MEYRIRPIGVIHSPFTNPADTPIQAARSSAAGSLEVFTEYADGLADIEGFSYIYLIYLFHRSDGYSLRVKPFLDDQTHGLFSTRHPCRPNPIGLSIVHLTGRRENILEFDGVDVLDGTPLLDIKPYIPEFDRVDLLGYPVKIGWYQTRSVE